MVVVLSVCGKCGHGKELHPNCRHTDYADDVDDADSPVCAYDEIVCGCEEFVPCVLKDDYDKLAVYCESLKIALTPERIDGLEAKLNEIGKVSGLRAI